MSRTSSIDFDEDFVAGVMWRLPVLMRTKVQGVHLSLRRLVGVPLSREFLLSLEGIGWDGDLEDIRREAPQRIPMILTIRRPGRVTDA